MVKIGRNIASLAAQQQLNKTSTSLSKTFERLSSGMRINHASDDPAGLAISSQLNSDSRVFSQALRNVNDGISYLNIADGALGALSDIGTRLKELATQSANGAYTLTQRQAMSKEADALVNEYNRVIEGAKFNNINIFDPASRNLSIQAGYGTTGKIALDLGTNMERAVWDGTYSASQIIDSFSAGESPQYGDFNGDGKLDVVWGESSSSEAIVYFGNGDGTFADAITISTPETTSIRSIADFNGDGKDDLLLSDGFNTMTLLSNANGTFTQSQSTALYSGVTTGGISADFNGDGKLDLIFRSNNNYSILNGNGDGTFQAAKSYTSTFTGLNVGDLNSDGRIDIYGTLSGGRYGIAYGNGNGTFGSIISHLPGIGAGNYYTADFNRDGIADLLTGVAVTGLSFQLGNGNGTFGPQVTYSFNGDIYGFLGIGNLLDVNGDGTIDYSAVVVTTSSEAFVGTLIGNGDGTFKSSITTVPPDSENGLAIGYGVPRDFNNDGVFDAIGSNLDTGQLVIALAGTNQTSTIAYLDLNSQSSARGAMQSADKILQNIGAQRGVIGAAQSRLQIAANNLQSSKLNYDAAAGRIMDADIASETANLVRLKILQQAGVSVLAQANQQPALALDLLKNIR